MRSRCVSTVCELVPGGVLIQASFGIRRCRHGPSPLRSDQEHDGRGETTGRSKRACGLRHHRDRRIGGRRHRPDQAPGPAAGGLRCDGADRAARRPPAPKPHAAGHWPAVAPAGDARGGGDRPRAVSRLPGAARPAHADQAQGHADADRHRAGQLRAALGRPHVRIGRRGVRRPGDCDRAHRDRSRRGDGCHGHQEARGNGCRPGRGFLRILWHALLRHQDRSCRHGASAGRDRAQARRPARPLGQRMSLEAGPDFEALLEFLRDSRGFDFTGYKRPSLIRRVAQRCSELGIQDFGAYQELLEVQAQEFAILFDKILINVTEFFRDREAWDYLAQHIVPKIIAKDGEIRVWSAGTSSGEEAYSTAILFCEAMGEASFVERAKIYATDVDEEALNKARTGYLEKELASLDQALASRYFAPQGERFLFRTPLRRAVVFGRHDLNQDAPISRLDLLICRNTLIYFTAEAQGRLVGANDAARRLFELPTNELGRPLKDLELFYRPVELRTPIDIVTRERRPTAIQAVELKRKDGVIGFFDIQVAPLIEEDGAVAGVAINYLDVTGAAQLRGDLARLQDEVQSSKQTLETTNEELQSTVEELETTNEELQSTNEELETLNEELESTNEELQSVNQDLNVRRREVEKLNTLLLAITGNMEIGAAVLDRSWRVQVWNERAADLWGVRSDEVLNQSFYKLDIGLPAEKLRQLISAGISGEPMHDEMVVEATPRRGRHIL